MKRKAAILLLLTVTVAGILVGCNSEKSYYNKGIRAQENKMYEEAIENFTQAGDYEDAKEKLAECEHLNDVAKDKIVPNITGLEEKIDITCGTNFNLNDFIAEKIIITDDVTENIKDYSIFGDDVYDRGTGNIDTTEVGEHEIVISSKDEANNEGKFNFILSINPVIVSKDNPNPVIYDGEYAVIKLKSFKHGEIYEYSDMFGYSAQFDVENKCDEPIEVYWSMYTTINDYQVDAMYEIKSIAPGKKGTSFTYIEDQNIPSEAGNFSQIDAIVCIKEENGSESFFRIPTTFYTDAVQ